MLTPALILGPLLRDAQYHLQKIESKALALWYERQIAEILSTLGERPLGRLDLQGEALFALGYYQQKADMYSGAKTDNETTGTNPGGH